MERSRKDGIVSELHALVFADGGPTPTLVNEGRLPDGWATSYLNLLSEAARDWGEETMWPRELVASVHFASWYLNLRYDVWCAISSQRNERTEQELAALRAPSEIFLMRGATDAEHSPE